ncbi:D-2-hydroxyacid dehydrogenase [Salinithrix halophila]|uniref:D-2-hydroxyacid dehydrogenase n=1 Tax=Salinithrix halophila TaxID=1485204 RepID=A0ABV8JHC6_9BACL
MVHVASSARMSDKHRRRLSKMFPKTRFTFCESLDEVLNGAPDADVLITYGEDLDGDRLKGLTGLRWIHIISAGLELLPFAELKERNIHVTNARGIHEIPMGEYAVSAMLQVTRKANDFFRAQQEGRWSREIRVRELFGKTVGIVGAGAIGVGIARRVKPFGVELLGINSNGRNRDPFDEMGDFDFLPELFSRSDFIIVALPLTDATKRRIGQAELACMKADAHLINIARGSVVDEMALLSALREQRIGGAVLDVFEEEPLSPEHPFWEMENVILTPHVAGRSPFYMKRALAIFEDNLPVYLTGEGEWNNPVKLARGY